MKRNYIIEAHRDIIWLPVAYDHYTGTYLTLLETNAQHYYYLQAVLKYCYYKIFYKWLGRIRITKDESVW